MPGILGVLLDRLKAEPVVVAGVVAGGLVLLAGHFNVLLDKATITEAVLPLVTAVLSRGFVTPNHKALAAPAP